MDPNTIPPTPLQPVQPLDKANNQYNNGFIHKIKYPITIALIAVSAGGGFILGQASGRKAPLTPVQVQTPPTAQLTKSDPYFNSHSAATSGEITAVKGSNISFKNDGGDERNFAISPNLLIFKSQPGTPDATPSSDVKDIETGKRVIVNLKLKDNQYEVMSISPLEITLQKH